MGKHKMKTDIKMNHEEIGQYGPQRLILFFILNLNICVGENVCHFWISRAVILFVTGPLYPHLSLQLQSGFQHCPEKFLFSSYADL